MIPFDPSSREIYREYKKLKNTRISLNQKILDTSLADDAVEKSMQLLGIDREEKGKSNPVIRFDTEGENEALLDFMIHEYRTENINAVERFDAVHKNKSAMERKVIKAYLSSYTSLFRVSAITRENHSVFLEDILNSKTHIQLIDIGLSESGFPGLFLFLRLVPMKNFHISSGMFFMFQKEQEVILNVYKEIAGKTNIECKAMKRFIDFFKTNKICGTPIRYQ